VTNNPIDVHVTDDRSIEGPGDSFNFPLLKEAKINDNGWPYTIFNYSGNKAKENGHREEG